MIPELKKCPCGRIPTDISIFDAGQGSKYANASTNCCGEWMIEFRTHYKSLDSEECKQLAIAAWNKAPRGE